MKKTLLSLCAAVMTVGVIGACRAYTVDDYKSALSLLDKTETYSQGIRQFGQISCDESFVSANPDEAADVRLRLGCDLSRIQKRPVEAVLMLEKGWAIAPAGSDVRKMLGDVLAREYLGIPEGATKSVAVYQQLIKDYPSGSIDIWKRMMSEGYMLMGQFDKAVTLCEEVVHAAPSPADTVPALQLIAEYQHRQQKYQEEVKTLRKIVAAVPDKPEAKSAASRADAMTALYLPQADVDVLISGRRQEFIGSLKNFGETTEDRAGDGTAAIKKALDLGPEDPKVVEELDYWLGNQY